MSASAPLRVLIIDDNDVARQVLRRMIELAGHKVVGEAKGQQDALAAYQAAKPDIVTLDLSLGGESGVDVLSGIMKLDGKAKVIVVSANSQTSTQQKVMDFGAKGFLAKPFGMSDLKSLLDKINLP